MTNDRPLYILPLVNYNVYWPIVLYVVVFIWHYKLLQSLLSNQRCPFLGNYGAKGMKAFLKLSEDAGICTAAELQVPQYADTR